MNLLLLLSALLSALSGAQLGARAPQPAVAVNRAAVAAAMPSARAAVAAGRPLAALPALADAAEVTTAPQWRLAAPVPLYLSRRRE